jgi:hypothetical protein
MEAMGQRPVLAYLDTNSVRDLFRRGSITETQWRAAVRTSSRRGAFRYCTSIVTFEELAIVGRTDWSRYCRIQKFLSPLVGPRVMPPIKELIEREAATPGAKLSADDLYLTAEELSALHEWSHQRTQVQEVSAQAGLEARQGQAEQRDLRIKSLADLEAAGGKRGAQALREWDAKERPQNLDDWVESALHGVVPNVSKPYPFTASNAIAFFRARLAWYGGIGPEGHAIRPSDDYDLQHFAAASYADVLISSDDAFAQICQKIPGAIQPTRLTNFVQLISTGIRA